MVESTDQAAADSNVTASNTDSTTGKTDYENTYDHEQLRQMKQEYLKTNVIDAGYDPSSFAQYMEYRMGKYNFSFHSKECV